METVKKSISNPNPKSILRRIRMRRKDSAFVYFVFESHEGICSYSTLPSRPGDAHCDMILRVPPGQESEVQETLNRLGEKIHELIV